jgi:hypothetical protein
MSDKIKSITKGTVWLQKDGQSDFQPVSAGTELSPHDTLETSKDAEVTLKCRNGTEQTVAKGTVIPVIRICTPPSLKPRRLVNRSGLDPDIPYIISPLDTHILTDKPTLRWNLATGAKKFTVTVQNEELEWTVEVSREQVCQGNVCELVYPSDKPPLQPGVSYTLLVKADANHSSAEDAPPKFTRLDAQKAEEVEIITKQIEEEDLPATAKKIKLSDYYADYKLIAEAIEILEELSKQEKSIPVYSPSRLDAVHSDLSPNLSPRRREALIFTPLPYKGRGWGLGFFDVLHATENCYIFASVSYIPR